MLTITVYGMPGPQGSKKLVGRDGKGRGILVESSKKVKPWRQTVGAAAIEAMGGAGCGVMGPIAVDMIFTLPKPKNAPKRSTTYPSKKPDLSKLIRSTEDALTDVGAIEDDARIVCTWAQKVYPGEGTDSLPVPGVLIRISSYPDK
jgi:Holliday junction resolvase RusA-like endonuclease